MLSLKAHILEFTQPSPAQPTVSLSLKQYLKSNLDLESHIQNSTTKGIHWMTAMEKQVVTGILTPNSAFPASLASTVVVLFSCYFTSTFQAFILFKGLFILVPPTSSPSVCKGDFLLQEVK